MGRPGPPTAACSGPSLLRRQRCCGDGGAGSYPHAGEALLPVCCWLRSAGSCWCSRRALFAALCLLWSGFCIVRVQRQGGSESKPTPPYPTHLPTHPTHQPTNPSECSWRMRRWQHGRQPRRTCCGSWRQRKLPRRWLWVGGSRVMARLVSPEGERIGGCIWPLPMPDIAAPWLPTTHTRTTP